MTLWSLRHAPTDSANICVGQYPVRVQIPPAEAAETVSSRAPLIPSVIHSSDLPRCADLARRLSQIWGVPHRIDIRLREISMGIWEGKSYDSLLDDESWMHWCEHWQTARPPGGESLQDLVGRVSTWHQETQTTENVLLVSHAGVVRCLRHLGGIPWEEALRTQVPHLTWQQLG